MNSKQKVIFIFRSIILVGALWGLWLQLFPNQWHQLTYYTLQSNIVVAIFLIYLLYRMIKDGEDAFNNHHLLRLKGGVTIAITLTFMVYSILLAPIADPKDFYNMKNYLLHYFVPIAMILDWLLFDKCKVYKKVDPILWTILPLIYTIFSLIKGYIFRIPIPDQKHSPYPYFFINIDKLGWNGFLVYFVAILIGYMIIGYGMYWIKQIKRK